MTAINVHPYLEKLEKMIDLEHVEKTRSLQQNAFQFKEIDHIPTVINYNIPEDEWPCFNFNEIFYNREKLLLNELKQVYMGAKLQDDRLYGIRANYGTGIIASAFRCPVHVFETELPISKEISQSEIDSILKKGTVDISSGLVQKSLETVAWYRETLAPYEKLNQVVGSQCLDIQGPFDNASIIWGSSIYLAVLDEPEKLKDLMTIICNTIIDIVKKHRTIDGKDISEHDGAWNYLGGLCIRNDSTVNLSGEQYKTLIKPFDEMLLNNWQGWIHFCGKAHQWYPELLTLENLKGINPYQGEFYQLDDMYEKCRESKIPIVQWTVPVDKKHQEMIKTGFSRIIIQSGNYDRACQIKDHLYKTGHADP